MCACTNSVLHAPTLLSRCTALQEGALTALASVADAANAHFIRYYDTVMPMLKNILYSASSKAEQLLRAKALECVSLVGMAVGKERFRADAQEVMAFMQQLQVSSPCTVSSTCPQLVLNMSSQCPQCVLNSEQTLLAHLVPAYDH